MKHLKTFNEGFFSKNNYYNLFGDWKIYKTEGLLLKIQPKISIPKTQIDPIIKEISRLSKKWFLVFNKLKYTIHHLGQIKMKILKKIPYT
jgi:hypothetical protein